MWLESWSAVGRACVAAIGIYAAVVLILRISGKRTLAKLNAFDLVVTVALGSALTTVALSRDVSLAEGLSAVAVLVAAQFMVARASVRSRALRRAVKSEPAVLVSMGRPDRERMRRERVSIEEIHQAVCASGAGGLDVVAAVVLETDGTLSVIRDDQLGAADVLPSCAFSDDHPPAGPRTVSRRSRIP